MQMRRNDDDGAGLPRSSRSHSGRNPQMRYFFGGVSGTGVSGPLPEAQEMRLSTTS